MFGKNSYFLDSSKLEIFAVKSIVHDFHRLSELRLNRLLLLLSVFRKLICLSFYGVSNNSIEIISSIKSIFRFHKLVSHSLFPLVRKIHFQRCTWFTLRHHFKGYYGNFVVPFCGRLRVFWPCIDLLLIDPFRFLFVQSSLFCELFCRITSKPISERTTSGTFFHIFWLDNQSESFFWGLKIEEKGKGGN